VQAGHNKPMVAGRETTRGVFFERSLGIDNHYTFRCGSQ
jgi:hypothetical protein